MSRLTSKENASRKVREENAGVISREKDRAREKDNQGETMIEKVSCNGVHQVYFNLFHITRQLDTLKFDRE